MVGKLVVMMVDSLGAMMVDLMAELLVADWDILTVGSKAV